MRCGGKSPLGNTGRRYSGSARGDHVFVEPPVYGEVGGELRMAGLLDAEQWVADELERWADQAGEEAQRHGSDGGGDASLFFSPTYIQHPEDWLCRVCVWLRTTTREATYPASSNLEELIEAVHGSLVPVLLPMSVRVSGLRSRRMAKLALGPPKIDSRLRAAMWRRYVVSRDTSDRAGVAVAISQRDDRFGAGLSARARAIAVLPSRLLMIAAIVGSSALNAGNIRPIPTRAEEVADF